MKTPQGTAQDGSSGELQDSAQVTPTPDLRQDEKTCVTDVWTQSAQHAAMSG